MRDGDYREEAFFYGAYGELLDGGRIYFGGRLIGRGGYVGQATLTDRLGSVGGPTKYYPYGQERHTTPQDTEKFATYYRDSTGLDYAWNRQYTPTWGRFMQADPYVSLDALKNPQGWNRYAYVLGDPVSHHDPTGLDYRIVINVFTRYYDVNAIWDAERSYWDGVWGGSGGLSGTHSWRPVGPEGRGGGAGGAAAVGYKIEVLELSKSGREQEVILARLREILDRIDEDCAGWLEGYEPYVRGLLGEGLEEPLIAHGIFKDKPLVAAISSTVHTNVDAGEASIVINRAGAFFNAAIGGQKVLVGGGRYTGGSPAAQVFILLHEIAHGLDKVRPDFDDPAAVKGNDDLIWDKCQKTLGRFP